MKIFIIKNRSLFLLSFAILGSLFAFPNADAGQPYASDNFSIDSYFIGSGGGNSTSTSFHLDFVTIGEAIVGTIQSASFSLLAGFAPTTQTTVSESDSNLVGATVTYTNGQISALTIPATTDNPTINWSNQISTNDTAITYKITEALTVTSTFSGFSAVVTIPDNTIFTGSTSWSGVFELPDDQLATSFTPPVLGTTRNVINFGLATEDLNMDTPIRILFTGEAGQSVAFSNTGGGVIEVTTVCTADNTAAVDAQLLAGQDCKINVGSDLIVYTRHLTSVFTYTASGVSKGGSTDGTPPSFSTGFTASEIPLVIGNTEFTNLGYYNEKTGETIMLKTKSVVPFKVLLSENRGGADNIDHVAIYANLYGANKEVHQSDTWISYDKGQPLTVYDPNGFFGDVTFETQEVSHDKLEVSFYITFAKPMPQSDIVIRAWDGTRNGVTATIIDAWEITEIASTAAPAIIDDIESIAIELEEKASTVEKAADDASEEDMAILQKQADELKQIAEEFTEQANEVETQMGTIQTQIAELEALANDVKEDEKLVQEEFDDVQKAADAFQKQADAATTMAASEETPQQVKDNLLAQAVALQQKADEFQKDADSLAIKINSFEQLVEHYQGQADTLSDQIGKLETELGVIQTGAKEVLSGPIQETELPAVSAKLMAQKWSGYHQDSASDRDLLKELRIISADEQDVMKLPTWTKTTLGKWMSGDEISQSEFTIALEYIYKELQAGQ